MISKKIGQLDSLLLRYGLQDTWYGLIASRARSLGDPFRYILDDQRLTKAPTLDSDLLSGLSVGETSILYEYSLAQTNHASRKNEGQYFTPDDVSEVLAERSKLFSKNGIWVDPCCGVGNLSYWLIKVQKNPEEFIKKNLYLVDKDPLALFIARALITFSFQKSNTNFFNSITERFIEADFLISKELPHYDYAILNPPYVVVEENRNFESAEARDLYAYFLERIIKTTAGFISITPQTFTNAIKFRSVRRLLIEKFNDMRVYCFDNVPDNIFKGIKFGSENTNKVNSTRAGIIVAKKTPQKTVNHKITPLLRWRTHERDLLLGQLDTFLATAPFSDTVFPKVKDRLVSLYEQIRKNHTSLAHTLSYHPTHYALQVPSTPRYFISALKEKVSRTSSKTLYFHSSDDRDRAYLLLNSSFTYWWWRVNDGGMTISDRTLFSLPHLTFDMDRHLVRELEKSEKTSKVYKKNAGKMIENVKHPLELIKKVNRLVCPNYDTELAETHSNSSISGSI